MKNILATLILLLSINLNGQQLEPGILIPQNNSSVHENAILWYSGTIERNPDDVKSILMRAELYKTLNMTAEANADTDLAMAINPYSYLYMNRSERNKFFARRNYSYDNTSIDTNNDDVAPTESFYKSFVMEEEYRRLFRENSISDNSRSLMELALIAIAKEDYDVAYRMLKGVSGEDADHALYHDVKGVYLLEKGKIAEAIECFDKAIAKDNLYTIAYHNRAVAHKLNKDFEAAEKDFTTALTQRVDLAKIKFSKGKLLEMQGDVDGAKYYYETAISTQDDYPEARLNYSVLLKSSGEYNMALIEINDLIDQYPEDANNYYVRGGLHFIYGEFTNAVDDFNVYLSSNPDDADVLFYRGLCLVLDGKNIIRGCQDINESIEKGYDKYDDLYLFMCE